MSTKTSPCVLLAELIKTSFLLSHFFRFPHAIYSSIQSQLPITPNLSESQHPQCYIPLQYPQFFSVYSPISSATPLPPSHIYYSCLISSSQSPTLSSTFVVPKLQQRKRKQTQKTPPKNSSGNDWATDD